MVDLAAIAKALDYDEKQLLVFDRFPNRGPPSGWNWRRKGLPPAPSNPMPRLIDKGLAKPISEQWDESKTFRTQLGTLVRAYIITNERLSLNARSEEGK